MEEYVFQQTVIPLSKKPDKDGFLRASFNIDVKKTKVDFSSVTLAESVKGLVFDDYGIHAEGKSVKITYLPRGATVISLNHWTMGISQKKLTITRAKAIAKAMIKRFPLSVPEGIAVEQKRQTTLAGELLEYTVVVIREEYGKEMAKVIAEERREFTRFC